MSAAHAPSSATGQIASTPWRGVVRLLTISPWLTGAILILVVVAVVWVARSGPSARTGGDVPTPFTAAQRAQILHRADNRCEHRDPQGARCTATTELEAVPATPATEGAAPTVADGIALCRTHQRAM